MRIYLSMMWLTGCCSGPEKRTISSLVHEVIQASKTVEDRASWLDSEIRSVTEGVPILAQNLDSFLNHFKTCKSNIIRSHELCSHMPFSGDLLSCPQGPASRSNRLEELSLLDSYGSTGKEYLTPAQNAPVDRDNMIHDGKCKRDAG